MNVLLLLSAITATALYNLGDVIPSENDFIMETDLKTIQFSTSKPLLTSLNVDENDWKNMLLDWLYFWRSISSSSETVHKGLTLQCLPSDTSDCSVLLESAKCSRNTDDVINWSCHGNVQQDDPQGWNHEVQINFLGVDCHKRVIEGVTYVNPKTCILKYSLSSRIISTDYEVSNPEHCQHLPGILMSKLRNGTLFVLCVIVVVFLCYLGYSEMEKAKLRHKQRSLKNLLNQQRTQEAQESPPKMIKKSPTHVDLTDNELQLGYDLDFTVPFNEHRTEMIVPARRQSLKDQFQPSLRSRRRSKSLSRHH